MNVHWGPERPAEQELLHGKMLGIWAMQEAGAALRLMTADCVELATWGVIKMEKGSNEEWV